MGRHLAVLAVCLPRLKKVRPAGRPSSNQFIYVSFFLMEKHITNMGRQWMDDI